MSSPWPQRRQGLSSLQQPSGLLKNIKGRRQDGVDLLNGSPSAMTPKPDDQDEESLNRPPDSSDSEDDRYKTADIIPTKFKSGAASTRNSSAYTQSGESRLSTNNEAQKEGEKQRLAGTKRSGDDMASHLTDARGFPKKPKVKTTFGKSSQKGQKPLIRVPSRNYSKKDSSSEKVFRYHSVNSSPASTPAKSRFKRFESLESSPEKGKKGFVKPDLVSEDDSLPKRTPQRSRSGKKQGRNDKDSAKDNEEAVETTPVHKFKTHFLDDLDDLQDISDSDSRAPLNTQQVTKLLDPKSNGLESDSELSSMDEDEVLSFEARCPMCDDLVDPALLKQHTSNGKMNVKKQTAFCRMHKRKDAEAVQRTKGYPIIDWDNLDTRLAKHEKHTKNILEGRQPSHYASILGERVEAGENRTLLRTEESLIPGYYGPRGLRVMTDYIMKRFSDTIRKRAVEDRLVSSRGYTGYVQAVLVPEMAVCLIMEDMRVEENDARQILSDSRDVGELVNEETKDIVRWTEEERQDD
ncbi:hypothetical protein PFICI_00924 [Pestalotiopsis fici W106-1]|uniref:Restriction of telomere capping protein 4 n=1 Tax=Pestalotiopsis fici (strain W106-1 / CGMCC3.15140) TaxID=1229662 RepID=W3XPA5_PESFW|nr:uncharacterized protein PFICI_00924 [Pestalotiopsis fici W106-1]ETS87096.1 hypothetical protein PFICI_00924 [Pestalotiopsis fici W106-1]